MQQRTVQRARCCAPLLASHLPFRQVVTDAKRVMLACAACGTAAAATVPLLHAAGAPPHPRGAAGSGAGVLQARRWQAGWRALLALGRPPVDMRTAVASVEGQLVFSCPIHCLLHTLVRPVILLETFENVYKT